MLTLVVLALPLEGDGVEPPLPQASPSVVTSLGQLLETVPTGRAPGTTSLVECLYERRYSFIVCASEALFHLGSQMENVNDAEHVAHEAFALGTLSERLRPTAIPSLLSHPSQPSELLLETVEER